MRINLTENLKNHFDEQQTKAHFPRDTLQLNYFRKVSNFFIGEEQVFHKWLKSNLIYNHTDQNVHLLLMETFDDEQLEGSGFVLQNIKDMFYGISQ